MTDKEKFLAFWQELGVPILDIQELPDGDIMIDVENEGPCSISATFDGNGKFQKIEAYD